MVTLNRIVAVAMVHGPESGLRQLATAEAEPALAGHHHLHAVRAHLLAGDHEAAHAAWPPAAPGQRSAPPDRYDRPPWPPGIMLPAHPHPLFTGSRKRSNPPGLRASVDPG
jgi:hypothetical protein